MGNFNFQGYGPVTEKYVLITAGRGPSECAWVVTNVVKLVMREIEKMGFSFIIVSREKGYESGTWASVFLKVEAKGKGGGAGIPKNFLKDWEGTLQWIGRSPYRKNHKRKNWFIALKVLTFDKTVSWKESDLVFSTYRASGPGGQHRNKVESAVRVTHTPTGLTVSCAESRSQHQNKKLALKQFEKAYEEQRVELERQKIMEQWSHHLQLERGNAVKVFRGKDFKPDRP